MASLVFFTACRKDRGTNKEAVTEYLPLKPGNYWVYDEYKVTAQGAERQDHSDSFYVEKDTLIAGKSHHKLVMPGRLETEVWYLRDSLNYLISHTGAVFFSSMDFNSLFHSGYITATDTIARVDVRMTDKDFITSAPAGIFQTSSRTKIYQMYPGYQQHGAERRLHRRFAAGMGIVTDQTGLYYQSAAYLERRLVRYKLQ